MVDSIKVQDARFKQLGNVFDKKDTTLEHIYRGRGVSDPSVANAANFYGLNIYKSGGYTAKPQEGYGYIFFTKPRLNLTYNNLKRSRDFLLLNNRDRGSVMNIVRNYLDPIQAADPTFKYRCPVVDIRNPFISVLTNQCLTASGWPDVPVDPYNTKPGLRGEVHSMADGHTVNYGSYTISCNFENLKNDFINLLFHYWTMASMHVHAGRMMPYKDDWLLNRICYNTRIYRLVTDISGMYITDFACTGASFPLNSNKASKYDYDRNNILNDGIKESSIQFHSNGFWMMDPIILRSFNETMLMFCPALSEATRKQQFVKLTEDIKPFFNHMALPYIDLNTGRLDWYVDTIKFREEMNILDRSN